MDRYQRESIELQRQTVRLLRKLVKEEEPKPPTSIKFKETTMLSTTGGNTLVFTGTLAPAGSSLPADAVETVTSNDAAVSPSVDSTGLVVTIPLPAGWVESATTPLAINYSATSPSNPGWSLNATITPSAPPVLPTSITFAQTT